MFSIVTIAVIIFVVEAISFFSLQLFWYKTLPLSISNATTEVDANTDNGKKIKNIKKIIENFILSPNNIYEQNKNI